MILWLVLVFIDLSVVYESSGNIQCKEFMKVPRFRWSIKCKHTANFEAVSKLQYSEKNVQTYLLVVGLAEGQGWKNVDFQISKGTFALEFSHVFIKTASFPAYCQNFFLITWTVPFKKVSRFLIFPSTPTVQLFRTVNAIQST